MGNLYRFTGCEFLLVCQICFDLQQRLYTTIFGHSKWNGHFPNFAYAKPGDSMRFRTLNSIFVNIFPLWIRFFNYFFFFIISEHKQWFGWCCHWMRTNSCMEFIRRINSHHSDMSWSVPEYIDHKANSFLLPRHWSWNSVYHVVKWMCLLLQQKPWVLVRDSFGFLTNRFDSISLFFLKDHIEQPRSNNSTWNFITAK